MQATSETSGVRAQARKLIGELRNRLPAGASVIDLGCGAGLPMTALLAESFTVTGVDFSARQLELARQNVPGTTFVEADMTDVNFDQSSFEAVTAFFSVVHVHRDDHAALYGKIARWLKPGGVFLASLGKKAAEEGWDDNWLGAKMFWSYHDPESALQQISDAGMLVERSWFETVEDGIDGAETFFWVLASRAEDQ